MKKMKWGALLVCLLAVTMSIQVFSAQSVMPLAGKTILVDSGHGGKDDGAQRGEVKEDAINLAIAMEVRKQLIEQGANVLMTREDDRDLAEEDSENRKRDDMKKRVEFIECGFCDMFVSIHLNAYPDSSVRGAQVFYQPDSMQSERMAQLMQEQPENIDSLMEQFVDIQSDIHKYTCKQMGRLKDKLNAQISSLRDELDATTRYELHVRLENMKPHTKITHGDFNPTNVLIGDDGKVYILDWAHAAIGNASADAAMTYLLFALEDQKKADLYLKIFCKKNDIAMQYVQKWLPIVAAAQMTKKHGAEKEFLTHWTQVVEFE